MTSRDKKILVTGATGNVGRVVVNKLTSFQAHIYAGVRNKVKLPSAVTAVELDFEKNIYPAETFDAVFLVRPPHLADPYLFKMFLESLEPETLIVFLSVRGADKAKYLPHAKIEKEIERLGFEYVFLRPSYFMENLTTTLWEEISQRQRIYLPSGTLSFNWIAISDVAEVACLGLLGRIEQSSVELCTNEEYGFSDIVEKINTLCGADVMYQSPGLLEYCHYNYRQGRKLSYILVMILLHYLPKFTNQSRTCSNDFERIAGRQHTTIEDFIRSRCHMFNQSG